MPISITVPDPGVTEGPTYASNVSDALTAIASHDHTGTPNGDQITTEAIDIDDDLSFNSHNIKDVRTQRFTAQASTPAGTGDVKCVWVKTDGELYYNNAAATPIKLTNNGSVNATFSGDFSRTAVSTNVTILPADTYTFLDVDTSASRTITLPTCSAVNAGRAYIIIDKTGSAQTNPITINRASSDTIDGATSYVHRQAYGGVMIIGDHSASWRAVSLFDTHAGNIALGTAPARTGSISLSNTSTIKVRNAAGAADLSVISISDGTGDPGNQIVIGNPDVESNGVSVAIDQAATTGSFRVYQDQVPAISCDAGNVNIQGGTVELVGASNDSTFDVGENVVVTPTSGEFQVTAQGGAASTGSSLVMGQSVFVGCGSASNMELRYQTTKRIEIDATGIGFFGASPTAKSSAYSTTNHSTSRSMDENTVSTANLAHFVGTLVADLQLKGLIG